MPIVGNCWAQRVLKLKSRFLLLWQWIPNILISFSDKHFCPPFYLFMAPPILRHCATSMLIFSSCNCSALDWYEKGILSLSILSKIVKMSYQSVLVSIPHFRTLPFECSKCLSEVFITPITFKCFTHLIDNTWEIIQFSIKIIVMAWLSSLSLWRSSSFWFLTFVSYCSYLQHFLYLSIKYIFKYRPVKETKTSLALLAWGQCLCRNCVYYLLGHYQW